MTPSSFKFVQTTLPLLLILLATISSPSRADTIYVTSNKLCSSGCTGTLSKPFDNLLSALLYANGSASTEVIFLYNSALSHYVFNPNASASVNTATYSTVLQYSFQDITIRPLYCNDAITTTNTSLLKLCVQPDVKLKVFLKTTKFRISITGNLNLKSIDFDAVENLYLWNKPTSSDLQSCLYAKSRCCTAGNPISTAYPNTLTCEWSNDYSSLSVVPSNSLFVFPATSSTSMRSLIIEDATFRNFLTPDLISMVRIESAPFKVVFNRSLITRVFFDRGVVYQPKNTSIMVTQNMSQVALQDSTFSYYNVWNLLYQSSSRNEGYFLNSQATFAGTLNLINTSFIYFSSSLRNSCWPQTSQYYNLPMNNFLNSDPRSRTNLWNQYHSEKGSANDYISSLVYIKQINGSISLLNNSIKNVIGTSGSVLRVDDVISPDNWFTFYNNYINATFAYDRFANIMISKSFSNPTFSSIPECPYHEMVNTSFRYASGCPGAYGNVGLFCYWDKQPPTSKTALSSYSLDTKTQDLLLSTSNTTFRTRVVNSNFYYNSLALSNSIAVIGSHSLRFESNNFQYNTGTASQLAGIKLNNSYFMRTYPTTVLPINSTTHFGQSTVVYLDRFVRYSSFNNTYRWNYGSWEGSMSLGSVLTFKNWIKLAHHITLDTDYFGNHQGITETLTSNLTNAYMEPLMTVAIDSEGTSQLASSISSSSPVPENKVNIFFSKTRFFYNQFTFDYSSYKYNVGQLSNLIQNVISQNTRYQSGLVKILYDSESLDSLAAGFKADTSAAKTAGIIWKGGELYNNKIFSMGCLFRDIILISQLNATRNDIDLKDEVFTTESLEYSQSYKLSPDTNNQGLFCITNSKTTVIHNILANDNNGILFNLFPNVQAKLTLTNSIITDHACAVLGLVTARTKSTFISLGNMYVENNNSLGLVYASNSNPTIKLFDTFTNNTGRYASLLYLDKSIAYEGANTAKWNSIKPKYKVFTNGVAPQGAPYFTTATSTLSIFSSYYEKNFAYSGLIVNYGAQTNFINNTISKTKITGCSILGTFMSLASLTIENTFFLNNTFDADPTLSKTKPANIVLYASKMQAKNIHFIGGAVDQSAYLILSDGATGSIDGYYIQDMYRTDTGTYSLFHTRSSTWEISNLNTINTTGLFIVLDSDLSLDTAEVRNITARYKSQFLFSLTNANVQLRNFKYWGQQEEKYEQTLDLIIASKSSLNIISSQFHDINGDSNGVFNFDTFPTFSIVKSLFQFSKDAIPSSGPIFTFQSGTDITINENTFLFCGPILSAASNSKTLNFVGNTIIMNSDTQSLYLSENNAAKIISNQFIKQIDLNLRSFSPVSTVQIIDTDTDGTSLVQENRFLSLSSQTGVLQIQADTVPYQASLQGNVFINNACLNGGAVYLKSSKFSSTTPTATLKSETFVLNKASILGGDTTGKGGAFHQNSPDQIVYTVFSRSVFLKNFAERIGGAAYFDYSVPVFDSQSLFIENFNSLRMNHIGSYPVRLFFVNATSFNDSLYLPGKNYSSSSNTNARLLEEYEWKKIGSGIKNNDHLLFVLVDRYNQIYDCDNTSTLEIYPAGFSNATRGSFSNKLSIQAQKGIYTLQDFTFTYKVNEAITLSFYSNAIPIFSSPPLATDKFISPSIDIKVNFRACGMGEFTRKNKNNFVICQECPRGYWQLNSVTSALTCKQCDTVSTICQGGNNVGPKPGYWRMSERASLVLECPIQFACLGNKITGKSKTDFTLDPLGQCEGLHTGNLCDQCRPGYGKDGGGNCIQCKTNALPYLYLVFLIAIQVALIGYSIKTTLDYAKKSIKLETTRFNSSTLMRILINYSQIFSLLIHIPISWPVTISSILKISVEVPAGSQQLFSFDCFYEIGKQLLGVEILFLKTLYVTTIPYALILIGVIFWVFFFKMQKKPILGNKDFKYKIVTTVVIICFSRQSDVIRAAFSIMRCKNLFREDEPKYFLEDEYDVECWESKHNAWVMGLALPTILIWVVFLPAIVIRTLWKNRLFLDNQDLRKKYLFVYNGYKKNRFYWEIMIMLRKLLFVANLVFINYINVQIYIPVVLLLFSYFLHQVFEPYKTGELNRLEKISLVSLILVSLCGLYLQIAEEYVNLKIGLIITAYCANFFFLGYFFKLFIQIKAEELKNNKRFIAFIVFLDKYFSCCMKIPFMKKLYNNLKVFEPIQIDTPLDSNRDSDSSIPRIEINSSPVNRKSKFAKYEACSPFIVKSSYEVSSSESPESPENLPDPIGDADILSKDAKQFLPQSLEERELEDFQNEINNDDDCEECNVTSENNGCEKYNQNEDCEGYSGTGDCENREEDVKTDDCEVKEIENILIEEDDEDEEEECNEEDFGSHDEKLISLPNLGSLSPRPRTSLEKVREDRRDTY